MRLDVKCLTKGFGDKEVLKGISLSVESGKALGILGRNGAGKTTTIRIIMDVFKGDSGEVLIDDKPIDYSKVKIGYLPEEKGLYPKKKVIDQLIYLGELRGMAKKDAKVSANNILNRLEISQYTNKRLDTLSKGNQQKVQLCAALICNPDIVILDEPFSGLDPVNAGVLKDVVKELINNGKVVLFSSHQMNYVEEFCNDIAILNNGQIVLSGNINNIKRTYTRDKIIVSGSDINKIKNYIDNNLKDLVVSVDIIGVKLQVKLIDVKRKNDLMLALSSKDFDIDEIKVYEPSLNDIFVEYTEGIV